MKAEEIYDDVNWIKKPVIGMALILTGWIEDSNKDSIEYMSFYSVGKQKGTGKVAIIKIEKQLKHNQNENRR